MLLNEYLALFRKALEKIEQYGFSDSIEIREEIRANKQAVLNARVVLRLTVRRVVEAVALYPDWEDLQAEYPELEKEDIRQALAFAARNLDTQIIPMEAA
jgi:FKBP-type peptidyl-prolyl cis-trans isomerase (trigger factor)